MLSSDRVTQEFAEALPKPPVQRRDQFKVAGSSCAPTKPVSGTAKLNGFSS
jgi:hypothetical protein